MELQDILRARSGDNRVPHVMRVTRYLIQYELKGDSPLEWQLSRNKQTASCVWVEPMEMKVLRSLRRYISNDSVF
jgi:hypothetical protein